jgi:hypothetical protein
MRSKLFAVITCILIAASVIYKLTFHLQEKIRFALLPVIRDYQLSWLLDLMIGMELLFILLLLFRASRNSTIYFLGIYFSVHLATLAYQKFSTVCNECVYHSNFVGESINISMLLFFCAIAGVFLMFRPTASK